MSGYNTALGLLYFCRASIRPPLVICRSDLSHENKGHSIFYFFKKRKTTDTCIPLVSQVQEKLAEKNTAAVICTCYGGRRGGAAADQLIAAGFEKTQNLLGGMGAWAAADLPIEGELQKH